MKSHKHHKKESVQKEKDQVGEQMPRPKPGAEKQKYRHMKHWLEDEDDYVPPNYRDEEE